MASRKDLHERAGPVASLPSSFHSSSVELCTSWEEDAPSTSHGGFHPFARISELLSAIGASSPTSSVHKKPSHRASLSPGTSGSSVPSATLFPTSSSARSSRRSLSSSATPLRSWQLQEQKAGRQGKQGATASGAASAMSVAEHGFPGGNLRFDEVPGSREMLPGGTQLGEAGSTNERWEDGEKKTVKRLVVKELQRKEGEQTGGVLAQLFCGAFAGVVSRTAVAPLDLIKTHLVSSHGMKGVEHTALGVCRSILQREGWKGLFRGNGINCLRVAPNKAIELCAFEMLKRTLCAEGHPLQHIAAPLSGGAAGMAGTLATYPLELMRTRISIQPQLYSSLSQTAAKIVRDEGITALYRGLLPSLLGVFPYAATNYFVYDKLRSAYRKATGQSQVPTVPTLLFGAIAASASSTVTFPIEVARRRLQLGAVGGVPAGQSALAVIAEIWKQEGPLAVYRGLGTTWLKLIPAAGISFVCYEAARVALRVDDESFARAKQEAKEMLELEDEI